MPLIPSLATERLILRPPSPGDLESIVALMTSAEVMRYVTQGKPQSPEQACAFIEAMLADARHGFANPGAPRGLPGTLIAIDKETQAFVGVFALRVMPPHVVAAVGPDDCPSPCFELGYMLAETAWGRGFASEGARALVDYGFGALGLEEIYAMMDVGNLASNRILEKLGFQRIKKFMFNGAEEWFLSLRSPQLI